MQAIDMSCFIDIGVPHCLMGQETAQPQGHLFLNNVRGELDLLYVGRERSSWWIPPLSRTLSSIKRALLYRPA